MFHPCFRNTQVHGTRKPHQLSHHLPAWGKKKSLSKLEDAKENHSLLPLPAQEEQMLFLLFSFQSKFSIHERCQVKIPRNECILLTCKSGNGDKSFFIKLLSPIGELISGPFPRNGSLYKEREITDSTISKPSIVGALKINSKYIILCLKKPLFQCHHVCTVP